ncbi:phage tail tube protein [Nocardioides pakistanensis]
MPKSLADGHTKITFLTTEPANPAAPTVAELEAGIDASCNILASDFTWSAADSDKVNEKALCTTNNANAIGASNFTAGVTAFRYFDATTGAVDTAEDTLFAALKTKGTELWGYARKTGKESTDAWEASDEIYLGMKVITDEPQAPSDQGGYIKFRVPMEPQEGYPFITAAAGI